jgi:tRNA A-37 threonylcarbamoyl transferase component Bud32
MASLIGHSLGRYQILEQLGEGGMATVYKAYDTRLERNVAIKVIRTDQFAPSLLEEIMKRFEREAKALAKLSHPNIVHVHDYGEHEGAPYLVMEYLPSGTLKDRPDKPIPWQQAVRIISPIAHALAYAHDHNIVHRDIKPANILLTENGQPMLSDFGIAKILESKDGVTLTGAGMSIGTPDYMAPEQWIGDTGPRADIYSLGVVLFELLTGRKPYIADTPAAIMLKQINDPLPRPGQFVFDMPTGIENVVLKALERKPEDRFSNMNDFASALDDLASGRGLTAESQEDDLAAKTLLASGAAVQAELAAAGEGVRTSATPPPAQTPAGARSKGVLARKIWVPIAVVGLLLCVGGFAGASALLRGLKGNGLLAVQTTPSSLAGKPTQQVPLTGSDPQASPSGPAIKVLWDVSHGPRANGEGALYTPDDLYSSLNQALASQNFVLTSGGLDDLSSFDVLVISEASGKSVYTEAEISQIEQFVRTAGHGLLILSDNPGIENLADGLSRKFSISLGEVPSETVTSKTSEPFFNNVTTIQFVDGGGIFHISPPGQAAAVDGNGNSVIAFCECDAGRVLAIADTNLWDNRGMGQGDNQYFAINVFRWLVKLSP